MIKTTPFHPFMIERLKDPELAAAYLDATAAEKDLGSMLKAIRHVVEAQGGIGHLAKRTNLSRTTLYKTLSPSGNPGVNTLDAILGVYDLRISFQPLVREKRGRYRARPRKKP